VSPSAPRWREEIPFLRELVLEAGELALAGARRRDHLEVVHKGEVDLVTDVDHQLQDMLVRALQARYPQHRIVAEEDTESAPVGEDDLVWYVDPLDGTTNFVHGFPFYAISIGAGGRRCSALGIVYAPALDELFWAVDGGPASLEHPRSGEADETLRVSPCTSLSQALLATGFPYQRGRLARLNLACYARLLGRCQGIRRAGSAALDLCYVAAGRLDGYWEMTLAPWDAAAGAVIAQAAGATVTDYRGGGNHLLGGRLCAATPGIHAALLEQIADGHRDPERWPLGDPFSGPVPLEEERDG
jgi:myo-inositol-1(or 4)-monophosphatase